MDGRSEYVLGQSERAARRLQIQDQQFGETSERLLDELSIQPANRVVEFGCGAGSLTRRVLARLGKDGVVVGIDTTQGLLDQARWSLAAAGPGRFEPILADLTSLGSWLDGADIVLGRAVLHHIPMAELLVGRLRGRLRSGTRVGFIEPDFRSPLARIALLESRGQAELAPLRIWGMMMNQLYQARQISPAVGATLGRAMENAGYTEIRSEWIECRTDPTVIENMIMCYEEVRDAIVPLGIMTAREVDDQIERLTRLCGPSLPPVWGAFRVTART